LAIIPPSDATCFAGWSGYPCGQMQRIFISGRLTTFKRWDAKKEKEKKS
jgi:hypothetical protein